MSLLSTYTHDLWKEDAITIDIVKAARRILHGAMIESEPEKAILSRLFKADGHIEETFGDLAVLVKVTYRDGQKLVGVAFYEAKRRDWNNQKLPAAKRGQLAQMHRALWNGHLLVFDRERVVSRLTEITYAPCGGGAQISTARGTCNTDIRDSSWARSKNQQVRHLAI